MKKKFSQVLGELDAGELSVLLEDTHSDPLDRSAVARIRTAVFSKTRLAEQAPEKKGAARRSWRAIAACCVLLIAIGFGTCACAVEAKEYHDAIKFFQDYNLSTDGLTRGEIKAVYRDITTASFTYSKTAEVIQESLSTSQVGGYEILQQNPTPSDIENLWNYKKYSGRFWTPDEEDGEGVHYEYYSKYTRDNVLDSTYFEKYDGDTLVWSVSFQEFWIYSYYPVSDGLIVCGSGKTLWDYSDCAWIAKIGHNGSMIWKQMLNHGLGSEEIEAVLENPDGSYAVFSRGNFGSARYFCFSQYTAGGKMTQVQKTEVDGCGIWNVARFGDGYLVQLGSYNENEYARIVKVDQAGNITDSFSYGDENSDYAITDMIEFDGKIYLSAYAVPKPAEEDQSAGHRYEIDAIVNYLFENDIWEISSEELTPMVRANYTAMLLVCDPSVGIPQEFYSVNGSLGGNLALRDSGMLLWDVESITTTFFSPGTNAFTIGGTTRVFRYIFDDNGTLISQEKTSEITNYYR